MKHPSKERKSGSPLDRAGDSAGDTLESLSRPTRDFAKRFFYKALNMTARSASQTLPREEYAAQLMSSAHPHTTSSVSRVMNVDKNAAYPKAIADLKAIGTFPEVVELRQIKYLNTLIEQNHRAHQMAGQARAGLFLV